MRLPPLWRAFVAVEVAIHEMGGVYDPADVKPEDRPPDSEELLALNGILCDAGDRILTILRERGDTMPYEDGWLSQGLRAMRSIGK